MKLPVVFLLLLTIACAGKQKKEQNQSIDIQSQQFPDSISGGENTIRSRFPTPTGYTRKVIDHNSFGAFLRDLPLKPVPANVHLFNGSLKNNQTAHLAVIDLPIGTKNLHQCADAVIRLRADYFYQNQNYDSIRFHFTNGFLADYDNWRKGNRIAVSGNQVEWISGSRVDTSFANYWKYLEQVFMYAGTLSLSKELKTKNWDKLNIGDVLIQGGSPGHAVIVVDMAKNENGEKLFMLAQSYMPAQEIQILKNPSNDDLSPWYEANFKGNLVTPEWTFSKDDLMCF